MTLEKDVGNIKKVKNHHFVLNFNDIRPQKLRLYENTQFFI